MSMLWMLLGSMATAFTLGMLAGVCLMIRKSKEEKNDDESA